MKTLPVYRFRCPQCRRRLFWPKESYTGMGISSFPRQSSLAAYLGNHKAPRLAPI